MIRYENWHKHSHYSNIMTPDCIIKPIDIAKRAVELGHTSLSTVEHGYAGNVFEYNDVAQKHGLKLVFGVEFYYVNDRFEKDRSNSHLLIMAKNNHGKRQLTKLISESSKTGFYHKPRIDKKLLFSLDPDDVIVTSTCVASYVGKHDDYEENFICPIMDHFKGSFFLEIHDNVHPYQIQYNEKILALHNKFNVPFVHANDTHYIYEEDAKYRDLFLKGKGIFYDEEDGFILDYPDSDTIFKRYRDQGVFTREQVEQGLKNTLLVDEFEDIKMTKEIKMPSIYPDLSIEKKHEKLREIVTEKFEEEKKEIPKEEYDRYREAIEFEMEIIEETAEAQTVDYFLLNEKVINRAKELGGVLTRTGRGSAPSFYINKLLGFTEIDRVASPIPLYPTRFMSKSRILETKSLPDIDFNTADPKPFVEASKEILGDDNVYYMTAYGTMQESEAFRNLCRAKKVPHAETNEVGKDLDRYRTNSKWKDFIEESKMFIGVIDSVSPHPCANLIYDKPISEDVGVIRTGSGDDIVYCALIDSGTADDWKYLKNDYLTVTVWQIIAETFELIGKPIPTIRELNKMLDDKVWEMYSEGLTATLNQAGTDSGTPQVVQYKPKSVAELSAWVSAIRPSFKSMKHIFLNRQEFEYGIPEFDKILESSGGFVLFQENIMATLVYSGFPEDETYGLIKAISKKKEGVIDKIYNSFIDGFVEQTGSRDNALKVWQIMEDAVGYGFNSSHALSVAYDSIYGALLKAHYPLEYYTIILNKYENNTTMTSKIYKELDYFGIKVSPIKFGKAKAQYAPDHKTNTVYKGMKSIKYISTNIAEELFELSKNEYKFFMDLLIDIAEKTSVNSRHMDILVRLGFFGDFGSISLLLELVDEFNNGKNRYKKSHKDTTKEKRIIALREFEESNKNKKEAKIDIFDQIMFEKEHLGYATTCYPKIDKSYAIVLDVNKRYTPKVTLYSLKTGKEIILKVKKSRFFNRNDLDLLYVGDIIRVKKVSNEPKWELKNNRWVESETETELHLVSCSVEKRREGVKE